MQDTSEAPVLEENQIGDPPLTSQQVHLCISFFLRLCISFTDLVLEETQIGDPLPPQGTCIFVDIGIYIYIYIMQPNSEQVVQEEHTIRVAVTEALGPVITYSRTVSRNVIFVLEFEKMYIEFLKVGKLTYNFFIFFSTVSTDATYPSCSTMGITSEQSEKKDRLI